MTRDPSSLAKQLRELSEQDFRSFVERVVKGMGLAAKGFRASGGSVEMEAVLQPGNEKYLVFATREVETARPHDIQKAVEKMRKSGVPRGIFITTGAVSGDAESYASQFDVAVADAERFGQLMDKFGLT
jgi:restriction endonuclease Mrr